MDSPVSQLNVRIPADKKKRLKVYAECQGIRVSSIVEDALDTYLRDNPPDMRLIPFPAPIRPAA